MSILSIIGTILTIIATILGGVWFIFSKIFKMGKTSQRIDNIERTTVELKNNLGSFPCTSHHDDLTKIITILVEKYPKALTVFSMKARPRKLNETGKKLFDAIDGETFLTTNKDVLFKYITDNKPLVALDVEQLSNAACVSLVPTIAFNSLKNYVYNEPTWTLPNGDKYDITVNDLCFVLGLRLRDMYLEENPEIG